MRFSFKMLPTLFRHRCKTAGLTSETIHLYIPVCFIYNLLGNQSPKDTFERIISYLFYIFVFFLADKRLSRTPRRAQQPKTLNTPEDSTYYNLIHVSLCAMFRCYETLVDNSKKNTLTPQFGAFMSLETLAVTRVDSVCKTN